MASQEHASGRHRPRLTVLVKLLLAFAVPTMLLFSAFAAVAYEVARRDLDAELGTRLAAVASSAATQIRGKYLVDLGPGDEDRREYLNAVRKLEAVAEATGAARIYVFDRDFATRAATSEELPIGATLFQAELDRHELERVFGEGASVSSVLFEGAGGTLHKAGYAPVTASENEPEIVLALGVEAPATYFARLDALRRNLLFYGAVLALVVLLISVVTATVITRPVRALVAAAERIGHGDLSAPVRRTSRDEIGFLAETMDEMRAELEARDERMQLMLSGIAHEVRNPLGGIELFAGILRDEIPADDERRKHVARIERELGYLKRVVTDFLDYARRPALELRDVEVGELVRDVAELVAGEAEAEGVRIAALAGEVRALADEGQLRRALFNLVRNAIQASVAVDGEPAVVRIAAERRGRRARIMVHNRGLVIAPEVRERLFEPFFTTREKGTGLGLAFVREIVVDHGGTIEVDSDAARGTTFTVTVPAEVG